MAVGYFNASLLRFDFRLDSEEMRLFWLTLPIVLAVKLPLFYVAGLFRGWWRYSGMSDLLDISKMAVIASIGLQVITHWIPNAAFPRSIPIIDAIITIFAFGGARFVVRLYSETVHSSFDAQNAIIIGAGHAGQNWPKNLGPTRHAIDSGRLP